jgi:hypothetical protein
MVEVQGIAAPIVCDAVEGIVYDIGLKGELIVKIRLQIFNIVHWKIREKGRQS